MKVFIENESGSKLKNLYNEKSLEYQETIKVARAYPYPYGFLIGTTGEDGDNVDVFVITRQKIKQGEILEIEVVGLMEQFEKSWNPNKEGEELDHNIIAKLKADQSFKFDEAVRNKLKDFVLHVFDNIQVNKTRVGNFLDKETALEYIKSNTNA